MNAVSPFFSCTLYEVINLCIVECMVSQESGKSLDAVAAAIKVLEVGSCIQMTFYLKIYPLLFGDLSFVVRQEDEASRWRLALSTFWTGL